jgi:hypothetical protein
LAIYRLLQQKSAFGPDIVQVMSSAYEDALCALRLTDRSDPITQIVAEKIIEVAELWDRDMLLHIALQELSGGHAILDIVGNPVANIGQFRQFLLDQSVVSFIGELSISSGFVSKIVVPVHAKPQEHSSLA